MAKIKEINHQIQLLFQEFGIKSLTMDDISKKLGCSKKTLYVFYKNRNDLVKKVITQEMKAHEEEILAVIEKDNNPIDEIFLLNKIALKKIKAIHPSTQYELKKYYPTAWKVFDKKHKQLISRVTLSNLKKGIKMGLYRKEINPNIMSTIFAEKIDIVFNGVVFNSPMNSFSAVFEELMNHYVHGVITSKGRVYFLKTLKNSN